MSSLFYKMLTDKSLLSVNLENSGAGGQISCAWLLGGGPSLTPEIAQIIQQSPIPKMGINLSGTGLIRPTYWTSYDPTERFLSSIYLDPGMIKFVHKRRGMDLVPGTTYKVCESPNLYVFERDSTISYTNFPQTNALGIVDWQDSMIQGIDLLYQLGYRRIYMAGCDMRVSPDEGQLKLAQAHGVNWNPQGHLKDFVRSCMAKGITAKALFQAGKFKQYHFDEEKSIEAAISTDFHYFRVSQYLRLARRSINLAGLEMISVTPGSRLNDYFPYVPIEQVEQKLYEMIGDPRKESTRGLYTNKKVKGIAKDSLMQDFPPHHKRPLPQAGKPKEYDDAANIPIEKSALHEKSRWNSWCKEQIAQQPTITKETP